MRLNKVAIVAGFCLLGLALPTQAMFSRVINASRAFVQTYDEAVRQSALGIAVLTLDPAEVEAALDRGYEVTNDVIALAKSLINTHGDKARRIVEILEER